MKGCERLRVKNGEAYFFINDLFAIQKDRDLYSDVDDMRYEVGNYFETKEVAELVLERIKETIFAWEVTKRLSPKY